jgi:hypothetical protein
MVEHIFSFGLSLHAAVFLSSWFPVTVYLMMFALYCFEGRFARYYPTISETATGFPNTVYGGVIFWQVGAVSTVTRLVFAWHIWSFHHPHIIFLAAMAALAVTGYVSHIGIAAFPVNVDSVSHFAVAFASFASSIAFQAIIIMAVWREASVRTQIYRIAIVVFQVTALEICAHSDSIVSVRAEETVSAIGEYAYLFSVPWFYRTFVDELASDNVIAVLIE